MTPSTTLEITEIFTLHLAIRPGESGGAYCRRLEKLQECGTWLKRAIAASRPMNEIDAILDTYRRLTAP